MKARGWLELDNPQITGGIKSNQVKLVNDGMNFDPNAIKEYYKNKPNRMPPIVKPGQNHESEEEENDDDDSNFPLNEEEATLLNDTASLEDGASYFMTKAAKRKIAQTDFTGDEDEPLDVKRMKEEGLSEKGSLIKWGKKAVSSLGVATIPHSIVQHCHPPKTRPPRHHERKKESRIPVLDPILLQPSHDYFASRHYDESSTQEQIGIQLLPPHQRRLPPNTKIEIFNRKTGRIMRGDDAVLLSQLPAALMDHAEYEPIVPPLHNSR